MNSKDYYRILGVNENSSHDEIKKAYRALSLKHHPDRNRNDTKAHEFSRELNEAYETLGDKDKKIMYDKTRKNPFLNMLNPNMSHGSFQQDIPFPVDELFSQLFGNDIHSFPGAPNIRVFTNIQKPTPIIKTINITLLDVLHGNSLPISIERWIMINNEKTFEKETLYINIPKGIDNNEIIMLKEKGNILNENIKGDIKIFVNIENKSEFQRTGLDLFYYKTISLKEALCGFSFELKHLNGKVFTINNNKGNVISNNHQKSIPKLGLTRENHTGNLIIQFDIIFPEHLSNETIDKLASIL